MKKTGISELDIFNKMIRLRNGKSPVDVVFLIGNEKDIEKALYLEKEILGIYFKTDLLSKFAGVYFTDLKKSKEILLEHKFKTMNIDVTGLAPTIDYESFIVELELEGLTQALLEETLSDDLKYYIIINKDKAILETLMHHYEKYDDNVYRDDDFSWFTDMAKEEKEKSITQVSHTHAYKKKDTESSKINKEDVKKELDKKPVHGSGAAILGSYRNSPVKDIEVSEEDDDLGILKPEVEVEKKKPTYTVKERLSEKEDSRNKDLLEDLRSKYEECIAFIRDMCNSQYRIILNMMEDAYNQNIYKVQFCPMYLEISEDRKTPLYHKLYEVDVATMEFQKEVVHQVKHLGCYDCGHEWDEEVTFLPKGPRLVKCPKCYKNVGLEKE